MSARKVLVTGATGFVGTHLCKSLAKNNIELKIIVRTQLTEFNGEQIICDLSCDTVNKDIFSDIDVVYHLAGYAHDLKEGKDAADKYQKINVTATQDLAKKAAIAGVNKFIFISSIKAGGTPHNKECADEEYPGQPDGIYGESKRQAELLLLELGVSSEMEIVILRPALVYGNGVKGNLQMMLNGIKKGWFPALPKIDNIRSMVCVEDLVFVIMLVSASNEANGEIFIVTDSHKYSSREIYDEMRRALGKKPTRVFFPQFIFCLLAKIGDGIGKIIKFPFDSHRYKKLLGDECYDSSKIEEKLGFKASKKLSDALPGMIRFL